MKTFFTVGPTQLYPTVPQHIQTALHEDLLSISHRSKQFEEIFQNTVTSIKKLLTIPNDYHIIFFPSATEIMVRIIDNTCNLNVATFTNGEFSKHWELLGKDMGFKEYKNEIPYGQGIDLSQYEIQDDVELICLTHNETSTGVSLDTTQIAQLKQKHPNKLIAIDVVSSAPSARVDYSKVDMAFFSVQKGFGLPAGLAVLILSPQALEKVNTMTCHPANNNFQELVKYAQINQTPETPNVLGIYLLGKVVEDMNKKGIDTIRKETKEKADLLYTFFDETTTFKPFIQDKKYRSETVLTIETKSDPQKVLERLKQQDIIISAGYKRFQHSQIRIANYPSHSEKMIHTLIKNLRDISHNL
jgi:phosphoserine aminotransferase